MGHSHRDVLIEAGKRVREPASEPECPAAEEALTVVHMVQHFANRPLSRRVRVKTLLLAYPAQKLKRLAELTLKRGHDVIWLEILTKNGKFRNQPIRSSVYLTP